MMSLHHVMSSIPSVTSIVNAHDVIMMSSGPTFSFLSVRASLLRKERETERAEPLSQNSSEPFPNFSRNEKFQNFLPVFPASTRHRNIGTRHQNIGTRHRARAMHALPRRSHAYTWNPKKSKIHQHRTPPPWRTIVPFSASGSKSA